MAVVEFKKSARTEPDVWQCRCGGFTFWLYSTGEAYCSDCRTEAVSMNGFWEIPDPLSSDRDNEITKSRVVPFVCARADAPSV